MFGSADMFNISLGLIAPDGTAKPASGQIIAGDFCWFGGVAIFVDGRGGICILQGDGVARIMGVGGVAVKYHSCC